MLAMAASRRHIAPEMGVVKRTNRGGWEKKERGEEEEEEGFSGKKRDSMSIP